LGRMAKVAEALQIALLSIIIFTSVISSPRSMLLEISRQPNIPLEFRIVAISIPDYFVVLLFIATMVRLLFDSEYRGQIALTANSIVTGWGGFWWGGLALWMVIGTLWAGDSTMLRFTTLHFILLLIMAVILADAIRRRNERVLLLTLVGSAVIQSVIAIAQIIHSGPLGLWSLGEVDRFAYETTAFYRAPGLSMHPNYLGGYLMVALFAGAVLIRQNIQNKKSVVLPVLAGLIICIGIITTLSRSAMLATAVGFTPIIALIFWSTARRNRWLIGGALVMIIIVAAALIWIILNGNIQVRIFASREFFFIYSFEVIKNHPVLGVGAGNLMLEVGRIWGTDIEHLLPVHNVYLYIWAELGLPGLALFLLGCFSILRHLRQRSSSDSFIWLCGILAICAVMLFDNYWWAVHPFRVVFLWVMGLWWGYASRESIHTSAPIEKT
jgi:O-antigen ligase